MFGRQKTKAWYWYAIGSVFVSLIMYGVSGIFQSSVNKEPRMSKKQKKQRSGKPTMFERILPR